MNLRKVMKELASRSGTTLHQLAEEMGYKHKNSIYNIAGRNNVYLSTFVTICDKMGYDFVVIPKGADKIEDGIYLDGVCGNES